MAMQILSVPVFPDVPNVPGVPPVVRSALSRFPGSGDAIQYANELGIFDPKVSIDKVKLPQRISQIWGLFELTGQPVFVQDSVVSVSYSTEVRMPDYPTENGGFSTYNRVQLPFQILLTVSKGGSELDRTNFLQKLENAKNSIEKFSVITPEVTMLNVSIAHLAYERSQSRGANLLIVEIGLKEIREQGSSSNFKASQVRSPDAASPENVGTVQAQPPTTALLKAALKMADPVIYTAAQTALSTLSVK